MAHLELINSTADERVCMLKSLSGHLYWNFETVFEKVEIWNMLSEKFTIQDTFRVINIIVESKVIDGEQNYDPIQTL